MTPPASPPVIRPVSPGDLGWIVERHGALYAAADGFDATFAALVHQIAADFLAAHDPVREAGWIAEAAGARAGCIFCVAERPGGDVAKVRLFLVEPSWRGTGLAPDLLDTCMGFARAAGYRHIRL